MTQINPITGGGIVQSSAAQRVQGDDKADQMRRADVSKNSPRSAADSYEPRVSSPAEIDPVSDQPHQNRRQQREQTAARRKPPPRPATGDEGESHIDVRA
jgi:hypothetical protein